ncbi:MAG: hypothetical protein ACKVHO_03630 [Verrucomicrobiia bacterium]|jgi:hypothetical protein
MECASSLFLNSGPLLAATGIPLNWFDAVILGALGYGYHLGKTNGAAEEHLPAMKWLLIVTLGGFGAGPLGGLFSGIGLGKYWGQMFAYLFLGFLVFLFFKFMDSRGQSKLKDSEWFGRMEYPLGIFLGMLKHLCIVVFFMALVNSKSVTAALVAASRENQIKEFGSEIFPTFPGINHGMFVNSFTGPYLRKGLKWILLDPVGPELQARTTF